MIVIGVNMEFESEENHYAFILFTIIIFLGVGSYMLIFNYMDVPKISEKRDFVFGVSDFNDFHIKRGFDYSLSFSDKKISNLENSIIWVTLLWGFMRLFDLMRFIVNYKNE